MLKQVQHDGKIWSLLAALALSACATVAPIATPATAPVEVQLIAFNDFHGNLEPPKQTVTTAAGKVPVGGAAYLATAVKQIRAPNSITVAAGDLIGASPLVSSLFLDEPTIDAMNDTGLALVAVGNHEFDRGASELQRMQRGGCEKYTSRQPCKLEPFKGASFQYLAANVFGSDGKTIFPGTALRTIGGVKIGFVGMTLKETGTIVSPAGVAGLTFADEATTANAAAKELIAQGASTVVLLIHQGGKIDGAFDDQSCPGLTGDILPIVAKLDRSIGLVVSGHTHNAYLCHLPLPGGGERLLTSAGKYGALLTDIRLTFANGALVGERGSFVIVQGEAIDTPTLKVPLVASAPTFAPDPEVAALVARYKAAAAPIANRVVGHLSGPISAAYDSNRERLLGDFVSDAMLAWTRPANRGGAQIAFTNSGGVRADLVPLPDGSVTYEKIFAMQPFGNSIVVETLTGVQLKALLEQQFDSGSNSAEQPNTLLPSKNFAFTYDLSRPAGQRIVTMTLDGNPIDPKTNYRVAVGSFLASGGDNFTVLQQGTNPVDVGLDLDATEAWLATSPPIPSGGRLRDVTPKQ